MASPAQVQRLRHCHHLYRAAGRGLECHGLPCFRYEELDRLAREREAALGAVKCAHKEQMQLLEARAQELETHSQALELQLYRAEGRWADATKEKDTIISR